MSQFDKTQCSPFIETVSLSFASFDIASYLWKVTNFSHPMYLWRPHWNLTKTFDNRKLKSLGYHPTVMIHLVVLIELCYVTDGHTYRQTEGCATLLC